MKKKLILLSLTFIVFQSGISQESSFELNGTVSNEFEGYIYLNYGEKKDSALVKSKRFTFSGSVDFPTEANLYTQNGYLEGYLYLENSQMEINVTIHEDIISINSLSGNRTAEIQVDLIEYFQEIESDPEFTQKLYGKLEAIISSNPRNQFSGMILSDLVLDPIFTYEQVYSLYSKLDTTVQNREDLTSLRSSLKKLKDLKIGTSFKDIELPDGTGKLVSTKDVRKSLLLVEFWASWCAPCRESNPALVKLYESYQPLGFEIFGVALESNESSWQKAMERDKLSWTNTIAKQGFDAEAIKALGIQHIPSNFLLDEEGKILAINIKPSVLAKLLSTHFK